MWDPNERHTQITSPSVSAGHEDVVRELIGAGADVKKTTAKGLTPLLVPPHSVDRLSIGFIPRHYAASKSRIDVSGLHRHIPL